MKKKSRHSGELSQADHDIRPGEAFLTVHVFFSGPIKMSDPIKNFLWCVRVHSLNVFIREEESAIIFIALVVFGYFQVMPAGEVDVER